MTSSGSLLTPPIGTIPYPKDSATAIAFPAASPTSTEATIMDSTDSVIFNSLSFFFAANLALL